MRSSLLGSVVLELVVACGGSSGTKASDDVGASRQASDATTTDAATDAGTCGADAQKRAFDEVAAAVDANGACTSDDDCTTIELATSCFDACTRAIAKSGQGAVDQAKAAAEANANACVAFHAAGCTVEAPPCDAPLSPKCSAGRCT